MSRFASRDNGGNSFAGSGLATNLPPAATMGRRGGDEPADDGQRKYRPPTTRNDNTWGAPTTAFARNRQQDEPADDIDDKWSKVFKSSNAPRDRPSQGPAADLPINSRVAGFGRGFGDSGDSRPSYADRGAQGGRSDGRDFGDINSRNFSDRAPREFNDRPPREFNNDRPPREFNDRPGRDFGDRPPREFNGGGRRNFGEGDGRRQFNGEGGGRGGGRRDNNDEWASDPRFAGKFGGGGGRDRGGGGGRFHDRERPSMDAPLPTAPKASLDAGKVNAAAAAPIPIFKEKVVANKQAKNDKKEDTSAADAREEKRKAEEEARRAKLAAAEKAREEEANRLSNSFTAVKDAIATGARGAALTTAVKAAVSGPLSAAGVLKAVLSHLEDYSTKWYAPEQFGDVIKSSRTGKMEEEVQLLYEVQTYSAEKNFPKVDVKGTQKKLIELLITNLLVAEIVDVEGIIAWADDSNDNDYPGRADAIVQTTGMVATLRASLVEEESEVDSDEDFDAPQAHLK